jgi:hypothetical protein
VQWQGQDGADETATVGAADLSEVGEDPREEGDQHAEGPEHDDVEQRLRWQLRRWRHSRSGKGA